MVIPRKEERGNNTNVNNVNSNGNSNGNSGINNGNVGASNINNGGQQFQQNQNNSQGFNNQQFQQNNQNFNNNQGFNNNQQFQQNPNQGFNQYGQPNYSNNSINSAGDTLTAKQPTNEALHASLAGTRDNIKVITAAEYPDFGLSVEIIEYQKLLGATNMRSAEYMWFMSEQNIRCRQIGLYINNNGVKIESGAMSYFQGPLQATTGIRSVNGLVNQVFTGKLTGEKIIMPEYSGTGILVLEPSFKHFLTLKLEPGEQIICDKGMFFATSSSVNVEPTFAGNVAGTLLGGEGIFQQLITGPGVVILESPVPMCEINKIKLNNDVLRVDGNFALLRSGNISMSVEAVSKSLIGSAASGEGLVNVYRGTGEVWIAPTIKVYDAMRVAAMNGGDLAAVDFNTSTGKTKVK